MLFIRLFCAVTNALRGRDHAKRVEKFLDLVVEHPVAITLLVKTAQVKNKKANINYHDIGDHLSREQKLQKIADVQLDHKYRLASNSA